MKDENVMPERQRVSSLSVEQIKVEERQDGCLDIIFSFTSSPETGAALTKELQPHFHQFLFEQKTDKLFARVKQVAANVFYDLLCRGMFEFNPIDNLVYLAKSPKKYALGTENIPEHVRKWHEKIDKDLGLWSPPLDCDWD